MNWFFQKLQQPSSQAGIGSVLLGAQVLAQSGDLTNGYAWGAILTGVGAFLKNELGAA